ncbi:hypothetical protein B0H17DRAFT_1214414 [Mycena rosella]|uniref:Uncharacterized protein n=1 Tax=Mycena rosella TaxID=1033263 RepID=A0AAD7CN44_MYCRO|nr:hypothetical protein B0H17DRAFT_1214414 [Mycena rosella]
MPLAVPSCPTCSTRRASCSRRWNGRAGSARRTSTRGESPRKRGVGASSPGRLRTRSPPTPFSVLPASFALHTAAPAPPYALLSCFVALTAPSPRRRIRGGSSPDASACVVIRVLGVDTQPEKVKGHVKIHITIRVVVARATPLSRIRSSRRTPTVTQRWGPLIGTQWAGRAPRLIQRSRLEYPFPSVRARYASGSAQELDEEIGIDGAVVCVRAHCVIVRVRTSASTSASADPKPKPKPLAGTASSR